MAQLWERTTIKLARLRSMNRRLVYGVMVLAGLLALSPISPLFWKLSSVYYEPKKQEAMKFCESFIPLLEAVKEKTGHYPAAIEPDWIKGKNVPQLIHLKHFYTSYADSYTLYFWNPGDFWDDFWADSSSGKSGWINCDANKPTD